MNLGFPLHQIIAHNSSKVNKLVTVRTGAFINLTAYTVGGMASATIYTVENFTFPPTLHRGTLLVWKNFSISLLLVYWDLLLLRWFMGWWSWYCLIWSLVTLATQRRYGGGSGRWFMLSVGLRCGRLELRLGCTPAISGGINTVASQVRLGGGSKHVHYLLCLNQPCT